MPEKEVERCADCEEDFDSAGDCGCKTDMCEDHGTFLPCRVCAYEEACERKIDEWKNGDDDEP